MQNQRLFRLTSQSNDGVFNTLFNEDIEIAPGSEIALQSASFERQSARVELNSDNNELKFSLQSGVRYTGRLPTGTFSQLQDGEDLLAAAEKEMNVVTDMTETRGQVTVGGFTGQAVPATEIKNNASALHTNFFIVFSLEKSELNCEKWINNISLKRTLQKLKVKMPTSLICEPCSPSK